jgi:hypothetical protein
MARMVFGQWQTDDAPARPEHARGIAALTLCSIDYRRRPGTVVYRGAPALTARFVTCLRCRDRLDLAALETAEAAHFAALRP